VQSVSASLADIVSLPYDFADYEAASRAMYACLLRHALRVEPRSCDEAVCVVLGVCAGCVRE
jgi:nucleotidyltransferase/DNA polymerase involved in DNA repair